MRKDIADKWVAALRSGDYVQGTRYLVNAGDEIGGEDTFCCLGVLACVIGKKVQDIVGLEILTQAMTDEATLQDAAGARGDCMNLDIACNEEGFGWPSLAEANDEGVTFAEIADYIEENYEAL